MARPLTGRFADWCTGLSLSVVPEDTIVAARRAVFDTIGVIAAGAAHPAIVALTRAFAGNDGPCSVVGRKPGVTPVAAALINGAATHAWDFDDTSYTGIMHGSAIILPAALAVADGVSASGRVLGFPEATELGHEPSLVARRYASIAKIRAGGASPSAWRRLVV